MPADETSSDLKPDRVGPSRAARRPLWPWFVAGYLVVFIGLLFTTAYPLSPNGDAVIICSLWQYYLREAHRAMTSSGYLGPASGSLSAAWETAIQHIAFSAAGGAALACTVWVVRRTQARWRNGA